MKGVGYEPGGQEMQSADGHKQFEADCPNMSVEVATKIYRETMVVLKAKINSLC